MRVLVTLEVSGKIIYSQWGSIAEPALGTVQSWWGCPHQSLALRMDSTRSKYPHCWPTSGEALTTSASPIVALSMNNQ